MIKFEYNGPLKYVGKYVGEGMMNSKVKPFAIGLVVQNQEDTCLWGR